MRSINPALDTETFRYRLLARPEPRAAGAGSDEQIEDYNRVYLFWRDFWTRVFRANGSSAVPTADNFRRQGQIAVLEHAGQIAGLSMHSRFDLRLVADREHSYMGIYDDRFLKPLRERGVASVMTYEYLTVPPEFRRSLIGVSLGAVLIGLGLKLAVEAGVDAVIAPARRDVGVHRLAHDQGAVSLVEDISMHETPCDLIAFYRERIRLPHDPVQAALIERLWSELKDEASSGVRLAGAA
jgi:hypothetical protein